jgi:hypothetical protein
MVGQTLSSASGSAALCPPVWGRLLTCGRLSIGLALDHAKSSGVAASPDFTGFRWSRPVAGAGPARRSDPAAATRFPNLRPTWKLNHLAANWLRSALRKFNRETTGESTKSQNARSRTILRWNVSQRRKATPRKTKVETERPFSLRCFFACFARQSFFPHTDPHPRAGAIHLRIVYFSQNTDVAFQPPCKP